jgi:tripartite-type tricarboxylate transporter receptor subunit TctC
MTSTRSGAIVTAAFLAAGIVPAQAQSVADFYRDKTINVLIGVGVGGEYDLQARIAARQPHSRDAET